jgi:dTDP-4-dehydrorhamnose 3,5-epimerase
MELLRTHLGAVRVIKPKIFSDNRGHFFETYHMETMLKLGIDVPFVQDNQSYSRRGVLRGLHYQLGRPQAKLVRVLQGKIFDVAVDIRPGSPTFGQWCGEILTDVDGLQMYVPEGFAHGFLAMSEVADVLYKCSDFYTPAEERGIIWNDPGIGIEWPQVGMAPCLSPKDAVLPKLADAPLKREYAKGASMPRLSGREKTVFSWDPGSFPLEPVRDLTLNIPMDGRYFITTAALSKPFELKSGDTIKVADGKLFINGDLHE